MSKNVSRFNGMYFGGNLSTEEYAECPQPGTLTSWRWGQNVFLKRRKISVSVYGITCYWRVPFLSTSSTANSKFTTISLLIVVWHLLPLVAASRFDPRSHTRYCVLQTQRALGRCHRQPCIQVRTFRMQKTTRGQHALRTALGINFVHIPVCLSGKQHFNL